MVEEDKGCIVMQQTVAILAFSYRHAETYFIQ